MINCLIIDDEPLALEVLETYIRKVPFLKLVAQCNEPLQALHYFDEHDIDLLFLDIHMPDISGIEFFKALPKKPEVIFTTAFSEYALAGFELNAIDYLLKPISFERFMTAVNRAKEYIEFKGSKTSSNKEYFFINAAHKIHKILYNDILYLEGLKDYTKIFLANTTNPLLILQNLKYFEDFLPGNEFVRIHRSYIVPVSKLNTITKKEVTIGGHAMPVSDNYRDRLFALIQK
ncbi:LytTR family DNA-binding domain-containing protein [Paraflavisolibacter sp. H34]|uniref:LytR/AlgR family response regulator transcription factor n=1 Tax=Huijunlia imazamoxiresistens TaxID=3127457 RepID=UPI00301B2A1F